MLYTSSDAHTRGGTLRSSSQSFLFRFFFHPKTRERVTNAHFTCTALPRREREREKWNDLSSHKETGQTKPVGLKSRPTRAKPSQAPKPVKVVNDIVVKITAIHACSKPGGKGNRRRRKREERKREKLNKIRQIRRPR